MNAIEPSAADNGVLGSDSDSDSEDSPAYYQPISTAAEEEEEGDLSDEDPNPNFTQVANGWVENGVSSLDLSDEDEDNESEATEPERAIERAFREDESRRNAPLTAENAVRVMEAMRRVSFDGGAPDWTAQLPEDQWIDRLLRLRSPSSTIRH